MRLRADQREPPEERYDSPAEVVQTVDLPVPAAVTGDSHRAAAQCRPEEIERSPISLGDIEGRGHLPAPPVVTSTATDEHEAAFTESESGKEAPERDGDRLDGRSFLLIVRTRHVVTMVNVRSDVTMSSAGYSDVPANSRVLQLPQSIGTAAVYRGLDSRRRRS